MKKCFPRQENELLIGNYILDAVISIIVEWNCSPSCIGSLPHSDPVKAVDFILKHLNEIPSWPQLPVTGFRENMYIQFSQNLPGIKIDEENKRVSVNLLDYDPEEIYMKIISEDPDMFPLPAENFSGFYEFISRELSGYKAIKGQVTGPISLGLQMTDQDDKPAIYDPTYAEILRKNLQFTAMWQEKELKKKCGRTIIFIDEPYLSIIGTPFASISPSDAVSWINEVVSGLEDMKGIHCCANTDWPLVMSMNIDVLSFDAYDYGYTIALYPEEVSAFLGRGGCLSWGIIPNNEETLKSTDCDSIIAHFEKIVSDLESKGVDKELLLKNSILTPQCGLSGLSEETSEGAMDLLVNVSKVIQEKYSLG